MFTLATLHEGYPVYTKQSTGQNLFFQKEFDRWQYAHRIRRWIVGPKVGDSLVRDMNLSMGLLSSS